MDMAYLSSSVVLDSVCQGAWGVCVISLYLHGCIQLSAKIRLELESEFLERYLARLLEQEKFA